MSTPPPLWRLDTDTSTVLLGLAGDNVPSVLSWGDRLTGAADPDTAYLLAARAVPHGGFDQTEALSLLPGPDGPFTGTPGLSLRRGDRSLRPVWAVSRAENQSPTLAIGLRDKKAGVDADLTLEADGPSDGLTLCVSLTNRGLGPLAVDQCALSLPVPDAYAHMLSFSGTWSDEFQRVRSDLQAGSAARASRVGRTSHHDFPGLIVSPAPLCEDGGAWIALHLAWSGDHRILFERLRDGRRHLLAGPRTDPGEIILAPGETFALPPVRVFRGADGLNGLRRRTHDFVRRRILPPSAGKRRVQINTWEAVYFRHDVADLMDLARSAADLGVERFVLDDGWFGRRRDDRRGLGDWIPNAEIYPDGLKPLADHVRGLGMEFGLWVEPEMVNADSALFEAHPDWILGSPGQPLGRHQYVLDLTREDTFAYVSASLETLVRDLEPACLKWDMNRDNVMPISDGQPISYRQTEALYRLTDRLRAAFPNLEIETCASGGGRVDYGILTRTDRVWMSDNHDPDHRAGILEGFSLFFPPEIAGYHIGPSPSHLSGQVFSMETRAAMALLGSFGLELDVRTLTDTDRAVVKQAVALFKGLRGRTSGAHLVRLDHPDPDLTAFAQIFADGAGALITVIRSGPMRQSAPAPVRLPLAWARGVCRLTPLLCPPDLRRRAKQQPAIWQDGPHRLDAASLTAMGLPIPILARGEAVAMLIELEP